MQEYKNTIKGHKEKFKYHYKNTMLKFVTLGLLGISAYAGTFGFGETLA